MRHWKPTISILLSSLSCATVAPLAPEPAPGQIEAAQMPAPAPQAASEATDPANAYHLPPPALVHLADAEPTPSLSMGFDETIAVLATVPALVPIAEVAQPELKLAALRFNPVNNSETRTFYYNSLSFLELATGESRKITGVPADGRIRHLMWSPDGKHLAFMVSLPTRVELWLVDRNGHEARRVSDLALNAAYRTSACSWLSDSAQLVCRAVPAGRGPAPASTQVPTGPLVEESLGQSSPAPTFQDLLHDEHDAALFEHYLMSEIWLVGLDGTRRKLSNAELFIESSPSPDASEILVTSVHRPFSYHVAIDRFPQRTEVRDLQGKQVALIADLPLADQVPIDFDAVPTGRREIEWRADLPKTLYWVEARDGGDVRVAAPVRDELFSQASPFATPPVHLFSMALRFNDVLWSSGSLAVVRERFWKTRQEHEWRIHPDAPSTPAQKLVDRSYEDRYSDPGQLQWRRTPQGTYVLWTDASNNRLFRFGQGASPEGDRPFVDELDLSTLKATRRFRSSGQAYETPLALFADGKRVISRRESNTEAPNYYLRDLDPGSSRALTHFEDPYTELHGVKRELITYHRADGLPLSGTLYLPADYNGKDRLPVLMWAYPAEFKAAKAAGQVKDSPYRFPPLFWGSPLFWLARGYAVLDNPSFPIVGEGDAQPNDTYVKQLVDDASAAIDELVRRGVGDRDRMAIGGHSYGAFTTANLLAHSRLFRAGIARSGAYNRSLTPFGFQSEERNFWEATATYVEMSPFMHASGVNDPLLLIHGMEDNNTGTFPIQSERFFAALKGLGKTSRLVLLPHESHGYRARESVMQMLWEMDRWLEQYVKSAPPRATAAAPAH